MAQNPSIPRPNVIIVIMDDLAYGDLGCHGNEKISTPHLDAFYGQSAHLTRHYSGPLCTPARASLMTGRYHLRTGAIDTYLGRSMMYPSEVTLAQVFRDAGYRTGIFGKWHLGDNYPLRAIDRGFEEAVVHNGGGIGQPGDYEGNQYHDPVLHHNGVPEQYHGYCTDIFTDESLRFIDAHKAEPFFVYLATNAPHSPLQIDEAYAAPYREMGFNDKTSRLYGMVSNIDENMGKLFRALDQLELAQRTIVIFTSDHGPCGSSIQDGYHRYNCGLRGIKGSMYDGGIRVPAFLRWPSKFRAGLDIDRVTHVIDLFPTVLGACGVEVPPAIQLDGVSLIPLLTEAGGEWPDRYLFMQWHRGDVAERYRNYAVIDQQYKMVNGEALYDLLADPGEAQDIAANHPGMMHRMKNAYDEWFDDVSANGFEPPRIFLGAPYERTTVLTRQDWRGPEREGWADTDIGFWEVHVAQSGPYTIRLRFKAIEGAGQAHIELGGVALKQEVAEGIRSCQFQSTRLTAGDGRLKAWIEENGNRFGVRYVDVKRDG